VADLNLKDVIIQQNLYYVNMTNLAIRTVVRVKETPMRAILNTKVNVSIIILLIVKKLHLIMRMPDGSNIIAIDQIKKNVIGIVKDAPLSIQNARYQLIS